MRRYLLPSSMKSLALFPLESRFCGVHLDIQRRQQWGWPAHLRGLNLSRVGKISWDTCGAAGSGSYLSEEALAWERVGQWLVSLPTSCQGSGWQSSLNLSGVAKKAFVGMEGKLLVKCPESHNYRSPGWTVLGEVSCVAQVGEKWRGRNLLNFISHRSRSCQIKYGLPT